MYNSEFIDVHVLQKGYHVTFQYLFVILTTNKRKKRIIKSTIILYICSIGIESFTLYIKSNQNADIDYICLRIIICICFTNLNRSQSFCNCLTESLTEINATNDGVFYGFYA